ncbi:patatin-like phospholipase family protein [uncultured Microbacterium sp.]|uniref:patatin-like phospholipase family protein n=1 Tax=uncultured Microbacterium sp. TaxID=191216 RepID=UPI0026188599|nr:patatin-like phospholipase family protein [uncultured Microbacterium sp.]
MNTDSTSTALVLGGGGSSGNAWLIGVVAGLLEAGVDVTRADLIVGTSAGATTAAQLLGGSPRGLYEATIAPLPPADGRPAGGPRASRPGINHLERTTAIIAASSGPEDMRRRLAASALELDAIDDGSSSQRWREITASRLPSSEWPAQRMLITAVDARTGEPVIFDHDSGVPLADAVAASTSSGLPHRIGDARFIDGGYRTNADNADLAAGHDRVLVLSPFGGRTRSPREWGLHLVDQVQTLRAAGSLVETVFPDDDSLFGAAAMNPRLRAPAARAGHEQGVALAERVGALWS